MAAKSNWLRERFLKLLLFREAIPELGITLDSLPTFKFYGSLHTTDPGPGGTQSTVEASYPGYARIELPYGPAVWDYSGPTPCKGFNLNELRWPKPDEGSTPQLLEYGAIGLSASGAGILIVTGVFNFPRLITPGVPPTFPPGTFAWEER